MNPTAIAILAYLLIPLSIGYWAFRRVHNEGDYFLAGRRLGIVLASCSMFATWFGAETVMGSSAAIAREGLAGSRADPFGYSLCLVLMALLLAFRMRQAHYMTIGDFFRDRFGRSSEKVAVLLTIPTSLFWAAAQLTGFGFIVSSILHIDVETALIAATIFVLVYTTMGGLLGDVLADFVQGIIVIIGLTALVIMTLDHAGGVLDAWQMIEPSRLTLIDPKEGWWGRIDNWAIPIVGSLVAQEALSRMLASRSPSVARNACLIAAVMYLIVGLLPVTVGLLGPYITQHMEIHDGFIIEFARIMMPDLGFVLFAGALLSAILSTIDSTLLSIAVLTEHNLIRPLLKHSGVPQTLRLGRFCVVMAGLAAYAIASQGGTIYELLQSSSSFGSAGLVVTVLFGLWTRWGGKTAALLTLVVGAFATWIWQSVWPSPAPYVSALLTSVICYAITARYEHLKSTSTTSLPLAPKAEG